MVTDAVDTLAGGYQRRTGCQGNRALSQWFSLRKRIAVVGFGPVRIAESGPGEAAHTHLGRASLHR